jgi:hypothetical protein
MTTSFKRLAIGQTFTAKGGKFRKVTPRLVFRIKEDGRGLTHVKLPFSKNTAVSV